MPAGRPTKYKPEFDQVAEVMCRLGAVDTEIAEALCISVRTLYRWAGEHEGFCHALKAGKTVADDRVERALYHRACGYSHPEDDIRVIAGEIVITPTTKHYPPDTTAGIFWLKNRRPEEYRQNPEGGAGESIAEALGSLVAKLPE